MQEIRAAFRSTEYTNALRGAVVMDLIYNPTPRFTEAVVKARLLNAPFVFIDVGVNGGIGPRWLHLGEYLEVHGFDPVAEVVAPLKGERQFYYVMGLGNEDGERELFVSADTTSTSFLSPTKSAYAIGPDVARTVGVRAVPMRKLDSLMAEGRFTRADFIKVDTEGFEPEVFKGATRLLENILAIEFESNFNTSRESPNTHFWSVCEHLVPTFAVQDLAFDRIPRASFVRDGGTGTHPRPATFNFLLTRAPRNADEALRIAMIYEIYGMKDTAYDLVSTHPLAKLLLH